MGFFEMLLSRGGGGGPLHIKMSLFHKKPQTWVPFYTEISLNKGPYFQNFRVYLGNCENFVYISRKIPKNGYLFCQNDP